VGVSVEVEELVMLVEADEGVLEDGKTVEEVLEEGQ
jgi:predicted RNase H-like HicB family nuclease